MRTNGRTAERIDGRHERERQPRLVIGPADRAYARSATHQRRVGRALATIELARDHGRIGVAFSGGKDSTCVLDLVRRIVPEAPAAFYDSGCEYPWTYDLVRQYGVATITPERSLPEMLALGGGARSGSWGAETDGPDRTFDLFAFLVAEPAWRFVQQKGLDVVALGLRGGESPGREANARNRGLLYRVANGTYRLCPLAFWTEDDVWGYIAARDLAYNEAYDRMTALGVPREQQRVSTLIGTCGAATLGRFSYLRQIYPEGWHQLVAAFPAIARYT